MNYITEINAFERWLETNYLPISAQLLWYKLICLFNKCGWCEWVTVDNLRLMAAMQMSREATFIKVRDELIKAGLIEYQKGKKGSPNKYKLISFTFKSVVQTEVNTVVQSEVETVANAVAQTVDINKPRNKSLKKSSTKVLPEKYAEDDNLNDAILDYISHRKEIKSAMTGRAIDLMIKKLNGMSTDTNEKIAILNQSIENGWKGIFDLRGKSKESGATKTGINKSTKNKFNNFPQREYDYEDLEKQLLNR